jgi:hypothetical protein
MPRSFLVRIVLAIALVFTLALTAVPAYNIFAVLSGQLPFSEVYLYTILSIFFGATLTALASAIRERKQREQEGNEIEGEMPGNLKAWLQGALLYLGVIVLWGFGFLATEHWVLLICLGPLILESIRKFAQTPVSGVAFAPEDRG